MTNSQSQILNVGKTLLLYRACSMEEAYGTVRTNSIGGVKAKQTNMTYQQMNTYAKKAMSNEGDVEIYNVQTDDEYKKTVNDIVTPEQYLQNYGYDLEMREFTFSIAVAMRFAKHTGHIIQVKFRVGKQDDHLNCIIGSDIEAGIFVQAGVQLEEVRMIMENGAINLAIQQFDCTSTEDGKGIKLECPLISELMNITIKPNIDNFTYNNYKMSLMSGQKLQKDIFSHMQKPAIRFILNKQGEYKADIEVLEVVQDYIEQQIKKSALEQQQQQQQVCRFKCAHGDDSDSN